MLKQIWNKYYNWQRKRSVWRKYGNHTKYHFIGDRFDIGDYSYGVPTLHIYDEETRLIIGKFCSIAAGVEIILGGNHHKNWVSTYAFYQEIESFPAWKENEWMNYELRGNVRIGNDVWIGRNVLILSGADIGDGAIIGAGSVVAGKIPPYSIAIGNPVRVIKYRFEPKQIERLLSIKWWDWPIEKINEYLPLICSETVENFLTKNNP